MVCGMASVCYTPTGRQFASGQLPVDECFLVAVIEPGIDDRWMSKKLRPPRFFLGKHVAQINSESAPNISSMFISDSMLATIGRFLMTGSPRTHSADIQFLRHDEFRSKSLIRRNWR